ncbi:hypothetical protein HDU82_002352 [Entophlyctis luteolus]|nr:hypothetical protein HDU82_002352 [Entophlyctis luteolus]
MSGPPQREAFGPQRKAMPSVDQLVASTPLFMSSLDSADPDSIQDNDTLSALQSLIYDAPPEEMAANFKEQGNEAYQSFVQAKSKNKKFLQSAIEFYSKGIAAKCSDHLLNSTLYCNRAAVNLELENYRKVLNDCKQAIILNPSNVKAFYRSSKALLSLDRVFEARDSCSLGLKLEPQNKALLDIQRKIEDRAMALEASRAAAEKREREKKEKEDHLWATIKSRGAVTRSALASDKPKSMDYDDPARLAEESFLANHKPTLDDSTNELSIPVVFLYPEHALSDMISAFNENDTFSDHISEMFGPENRPPWDTAGLYVPEKIEIYFETRPDLDAAARGAEYKETRDGKRKLMRVDVESTLRDVLATSNESGFRLVEGVATFFVLSGASTAFAKGFRRRYK